MKTVAIAFSDRGNKSLEYIAGDINKYAKDHDLEFISMTNLVHFSISEHRFVTECIVIFKVKEEDDE